MGIWGLRSCRVIPKVTSTRKIYPFWVQVYKNNLLLVEFNGLNFKNSIFHCIEFQIIASAQFCYIPIQYIVVIIYQYKF